MGTWRRPYIRNAKEPEYPRRRKRAGWGRIAIQRRIRQRGWTGKGWRWRKGRYRPVVNYRFGWWKKSALEKMKRSEREALWKSFEGE